MSDVHNDAQMVAAGLVKLESGSVRCHVREIGAAGMLVNAGAHGD